jgi:hypothetical protein
VNDETYVNEKSLRTSAARRTPTATATATKAATSAFWADNASRLRRRYAPVNPATTA